MPCDDVDYTSFAAKRARFVSERRGWGEKTKEEKEIVRLS